MRYTDKITFVAKPKDHYDPDAGGMVSDPPVETVRTARITKPVKEKGETLISNQSVNQKIVHMKQPYLGEYDHAMINGKKYFFINQSISGTRQIIYMRGDS